MSTFIDGIGIIFVHLNPRENHDYAILAFVDVYSVQ